QGRHTSGGAARAVAVLHKTIWSFPFHVEATAAAFFKPWQSSAPRQINCQALLFWSFSRHVEANAAVPFKP
ncbi:hypothetical protein SB748_35740, partial [Rhizobium sp. SIMBA_035]